MKRAKVLTAAAFLLLLCAPAARACSCGEQSVRQKFRYSDAVFLGRVVELTPFGPTEDFPLAVSLVRFEVERRWKGAKARELTGVADFDQPGFCGDLKLAVGGRYLIYAPREKGRLRVLTDCGPNTTAEYAGPEMKRLDSLWFRTTARLYPFPKF
ncbi:MAG TPA: hypothetical protein VF508_09600 [Pyrinomonadaceae bacterium]|jgi:hypothetical protein